uniref:Uncharacterized protein n=1 Tax=Sipha flava TaxID=143950 RepID=A0A2S2PUX6_9HEMI
MRKSRFSVIGYVKPSLCFFHVVLRTIESCQSNYFFNMALPLCRKTPHYSCRDRGYIQRPWPHRSPRHCAEAGGSTAGVDRAADSVNMVIASVAIRKPKPATRVP